MSKQTAGQRWLAKKMESPSFAGDFKAARAEVDAVDQFIRAIDAQREELGFSKEELAQKVSQNPSSLRRLLSSGGNPTLKNVIELAEAVGLVVKIEPKKSPRRASSTVSTRATAP